MAPPLWRLDLRPLAYRTAWDFQRDLVERRQRGEIPDVLLLTEHPPVFTLGKSAHRENLLEPPEALAGRGAEVVETDRGGDVTFHGPGQLVAYPIVHLGGWQKDVHAYLRALEAAAIDTAAGFGTAATRRDGLTGVWCGAGGTPRKLASIGVRVSRWVASHGMAFNVTTDPWLVLAHRGVRHPGCGGHLARSGNRARRAAGRGRRPAGGCVRGDPRPPACAGAG